MKRNKLIILTIAFLLAACTGDYLSEVFNEVCEPPCWNGVELGMSKDQVQNLIEDMDYFIRHDSERDDLVILQRGSSDAIYLEFQNDQLSVIRITPPNKQKQNLSDALAYFGVPDFVLGLYGTSGFSSLTTITFCYVDQGIELQTKLYDVKYPPFQEVGLNENVFIRRVSYYDAENLVGGFWTYPCLNADDPDYVFSKWEGYGDYRTCNPELNSSCFLGAE